MEMNRPISAMKVTQATAPKATARVARRPSPWSPMVAAMAMPIDGPRKGAMTMAPITMAVCPLRMPRPAIRAEIRTVKRKL